MIRTAIGAHLLSNIERIQVIAASDAVFMRITTQPQVMSAEDTGVFRYCERWNVDGLNVSLNRRGIQFETRSVRPMMMSMMIDLYFPMGQSIDVAFQKYVNNEDGELFNAPFAGAAPVIPRATQRSPTDGHVPRRRRSSNMGSNYREMPNVTAITQGEVPRELPDNGTASTILPDVLKKEKAKRKPKRAAEFKPSFKNMDVNSDF